MNVVQYFVIANAQTILFTTSNRIPKWPLSIIGVTDTTGCETIAADKTELTEILSFLEQDKIKTESP